LSIVWKEPDVDWENDIHARCVRLRHKSRALQLAAAAARDVYAYGQRQQARRRESPPAVAAALSAAPQRVDAHDAAMETLRAIRAMLEAFPLEWQVAMVKALTARTLIVARERLQRSTAMSA
jgi:hypothetical protein